MHKDVYMPMIGTAEVVVKRYNIAREAQDEYSLQSQQRTAAAQTAGKFADEIVACKATMGVMDKETKEVSFKEVVADKDECNRPDTRSEEHTSELQSLMRISYAVFCLKKKTKQNK